ncbi:MAG: MoaD/ThiS family protein [Treponema sp.]|jgi:molybdopterin converting factor small subunit|nr:MoaD/ThiS family protein [Treponema sp.]
MANKITVRYRARLADLTGTGEEIIEADDVREALRLIERKHGAAAERVAKTMLIAVNGESILHLKLYKTPLQAGDVLSFLPICGGG